MFNKYILYDSITSRNLNSFQAKEINKNQGSIPNNYCCWFCWFCAFGGGGIPGRGGPNTGIPLPGGGGIPGRGGGGAGIPGRGGAGGPLIICPGGGGPIGLCPNWGGGPGYGCGGPPPGLAPGAANCGGCTWGGGPRTICGGAPPGYPGIWPGGRITGAAGYEIGGAESWGIGGREIWGCIMPGAGPPTPQTGPARPLFRKRRRKRERERERGKILGTKAKPLFRVWLGFIFLSRVYGFYFSLLSTLFFFFGSNLFLKNKLEFGKLFNFNLTYTPCLIYIYIYIYIKDDNVNFNYYKYIKNINLYKKYILKININYLYFIFFYINLYF